MDLMLLSRVLSDVEVKRGCAVYSSYQTKQIEDISEQVRMFVLVGEMQELTSFGSARTLRTYYGDNAEEKIQELLTSLENINESVTLCRSEMIDGQIQTFNRAIKTAEQCRELLMCSLIPAFRSKFRGCAKEKAQECNEPQEGNCSLVVSEDAHTEMDIIGLICWYVDSDMLQKALTVCTECMHKLIFDYLVNWDQQKEPKVDRQDYEDEFAMQLTKGLLKLSKGKNAWVSTLKNFEQLILNFGHTVRCASSENFKCILRDYLWVKVLRNMSNHASDGINKSSRSLQAMERLRTLISAPNQAHGVITDANKRKIAGTHSQS